MRWWFWSAARVFPRFSLLSGLLPCCCIFTLGFCCVWMLRRALLVIYQWSAPHFAVQPDFLFFLWPSLMVLVCLLPNVRWWFVSVWDWFSLLFFGVCGLLPSWRWPWVLPFLSCWVCPSFFAPLIVNGVSPFLQPSISLGPFVVTAECLVPRRAGAFQPHLFPGRVSFGLPFCFPLIKRRSDAHSILFVIRSGSFVPSYLNSFCSTANHTVVSLFLYRSLVALTSRRCTFQRLVAARLFYASNCGRTGSDMRSLALTGVVVRARCQFHTILFPAHSLLVD